MGIARTTRDFRSTPHLPDGNGARISYGAHRRVKLMLGRALARRAAGRGHGQASSQAIAASGMPGAFGNGSSAGRRLRSVCRFRRSQAYREPLAHITRAALMGAATGVTPGPGVVSQKETAPYASVFAKRRAKLRMELQAYLRLVLPDSPRAKDRLTGWVGTGVNNIHKSSNMKARRCTLEPDSW